MGYPQLLAYGQDPSSPTPGLDAIQQLEREGLVTTSLREGRIEPTPAFWPWLEGLRAAEVQAGDSDGRLAPRPWAQGLAAASHPNY